MKAVDSTKAMQDFEIVDLYWARSQDAIYYTAEKYGQLLMQTSYSVLRVRQDCEECVNDTYLNAWNKMPTDRPTYLGAYLTKIVRGLSIDRWRRAHADKRGGSSYTEAELTECIPSDFCVDRELESGMLRDTLNAFLASLDAEKRVIFVRRYFYCESVAEIASSLNIGESKVKTTLFRLRAKLYEILSKEELL